jgi:hypothetical protein
VIRDWIRLVENERLENPKLFYHGTNMAAGCMIIRDGSIKATNPVDDDDLGAVVCVTELSEMGHNFAVEFVRTNSEYPVGVVFTLNAEKILRDFNAVPYEAETASDFEGEYRVQADIPLKGYCLGIRLVGDLDELRSQVRSMDRRTGEMQTLKERIFNDWRQYFTSWSQFNNLWTRLLRRATR